MAGNKQTALDWTTVNIFGTDYIALATSIKFTADIKTAEGKGIADIDAWPVLAGRENSVSLDLMVPKPGTASLMGTAQSANPSGTISLNSGANTYSGSAVLTNVGHTVERDGIQMQSVTLGIRGSVTVA